MDALLTGSGGAFSSLRAAAAAGQGLDPDAKKHGIGAGIHTGSVEYTKRYLEQGFNMVMLGQDTGFMARMARKELAQVRNDTGAEKIDPKDNFY